ncbi:MAG: ABC transporter substrate-binding protein [Candidatus Heimdallarchaeota archaeon]
MRRKSKTKIIVYFVLGILILNGILMVDSKQIQAKAPLFTLVAKTIQYLDYDHVAYFNLISTQLARIGIEVDVIVQDWPGFGLPDPFFLLWNFDLAIITLDEILNYPTLMCLFSENGSCNIFGYHTERDWDDQLGNGINQWYLEQLDLILPPQSEERIQHFWDWENYLMDELLLMQPLFCKKTYSKYWDNLRGYNFTEGLIQSWGKMSWDGVHSGQNNTSEIVISDEKWKELNPIFQRDSDQSSKFISSAILDPLFWTDSDSFIKTHLAKGFTIMNDTHYRLHLREGIKWQNDPDGNFTNEYFDAEDVYFTLYSLSKMYCSTFRFNWLKDMVIVDSHTIDLFVDGNHYTTKKEPYAQFLEDLNVKILPEHYLNQTQEIDGITPLITHLSWLKYSTNCFGTGLFKLKSCYPDFETILSIHPDCWWLNSTVTNDPLLDWENRFGSFSSNINQLRINVHTHPLVAMFNFDAGLIDITPALGSKPSPTPKCEIQEKSPDYITFIAYNTREVRPNIGGSDPCVNDPSITKGLAIRKAISYAINRKEMNQVSHGGEYYIVDNPIYKTHKIWCNPNIIKYDHDLEKAKYYLELAGYSSNSSIIGLDPSDLFYLTFSVFVVILVFKRKQIKSNH